MAKSLNSEPVDTEKVDHESVFFFFHSNSVIQFEDPEMANENLKKFFEAAKVFYNANQLQINGQKTNVLVIDKPNKKKYADKIVLETEKKPGETK